MEQEKNSNLQQLVIQKLLGLVIALVIIITGLSLSFVFYFAGKGLSRTEETTPIQTDNSLAETAPAESYWQAPEESGLNSNPDKDKILLGREIIMHTASFFGPMGKISPGSTNGMNCQNCHLDAGTKVYGNNYSAVASTYPKYRARSGMQENIYKRVNDCFERSLNGKPLDTASLEMQAIVSYLKWLGQDVPKGEKPKGSGLKDLPFLDRAADPVQGETAYQSKCSSCHGTNGEGVMNADKTAFTYPPLWGGYSYNSGAGLYRLSNFARYVKYNMPLGASHDDPQLSNEEAWDIAAFVNSQSRPSMNLKADWPDKAEKPFDHPFGPFADVFSEKQHKYGPFQPIQDQIEKNKKK